MATIKFRIEVNEDKVTCVTKMINEEGETYLFPVHLQPLNLHTELGKLQIVKAQSNAIKNKIGHFRHVKISSQAIHQIYFDDDDNPIFCDEFLEEIDQSTKTNIKSSREEELTVMVLDLQQKLQLKDKMDLHKAKKKFVLDTYDGKTDVNLFLLRFENECLKYGVEEDSFKIEILKVFVSGVALEWYYSALLDFKSWYEWKTDMKAMFGKSRVAAACYAFDYKYVSGKLNEYVIRKKKLLLEASPNMINETLILLIIAGLPHSIRDKIKADEIDSVTKLSLELSCLEMPKTVLSKKKYDEKPQKTNKMVEKKPCSYCLDTKKKALFHSEDKCWFKNNKKINLTEDLQEESSEDESSKN